MRIRGALGGLAALGAALACAPAAPTVDRVVLVVVDTLRADVLPFHGGEPDTAPFLDELARRSLVFENAWSASSWTAPATASIFTSTWPDEHGVVTGVVASQLWQLRLTGLPEALETIPEFLREQGFRTFGVSANPNIGPRLGFERGFDRFAQLEYGGTRGEALELVEALLAWRDEIVAAERAFLYLHLMDPHEPYRRGPSPPRGRGRRLLDVHREAYRQEVRRADDGIRRLFDALPLEGALVLVTSDHGEEFREHGGRGHGVTLYSELTRVPLILHLPGGPVGRVSRNVSTLDLLPTLRQLLGAEASTQDAGLALLAPGGTRSPGREAGEPRAVFAMRRNPPGTVRKRAVVRERFKLILTEPGGSTELYDLAEDPREQHDLAAERGEAVAELRALLDARAREARAIPSEPAPLRLSEEERRRLEELGYVDEGGS